MGGSNDTTNIVELSIEEHAKAHKKLWIKYGKLEDYIAWKALSGSLGKDEFIKLRCSLGGKIQGPKNKGWVPTDETRKIWSKQRIGQPGRNTGCRWTDTEETKRKKSEAAKGKSKSENMKRLTSLHKSKTYKVITPMNEMLMITNLSEYCKQVGLTEALMYKVANGSRAHHKGYKCSKIEGAK